MAKGNQKNVVKLGSNRAQKSAADQRLEELRRQAVTATPLYQGKDKGGIGRQAPSVVQVLPGETFADVAARTGRNIEDILKANADVAKLSTGMGIKVPPLAGYKASEAGANVPTVPSLSPYKASEAGLPGFTGHATTMYNPRYGLTTPVSPLPDINQTTYRNPVTQEVTRIVKPQQTAAQAFSQINTPYTGSTPGTTASKNLGRGKGYTISGMAAAAAKAIATGNMPTRIDPNAVASLRAKGVDVSGYYDARGFLRTSATGAGGAGGGGGGGGAPGGSGYGALGENTYRAPGIVGSKWKVKWWQDENGNWIKGTVRARGGGGGGGGTFARSTQENMEPTQFGLVNWGTSSGKWSVSGG